MGNKVMSVRPNTLANVIDMVIIFDEYFACSQEVNRKKGLLVPPTKFKKVLSVFKGTQKPLHRPPRKMRPPPAQYHSQPQFLPIPQISRLTGFGCTLCGKQHLGKTCRKIFGMQINQIFYQEISLSRCQTSKFYRVSKNPNIKATDSIQSIKTKDIINTISSRAKANISFFTEGQARTQASRECLVSLWNICKADI